MIKYLDKFKNTKMTENKNNTQGQLDKKKIHTLESDLKVAFSQKKYDSVKTLADQLQALDAKNRIAVKLLERVKKEEDAKVHKENELKNKVIETKIVAAVKAGKFDEAFTSLEELKAIDSKNSAIAKNQMSIEKAQASFAKEKHQKEITAIEGKMNAAFKAKKFDEVKAISDELHKLDPQNKLAAKLVSKIEDAKNEEKIKGLLKELSDLTKKKSWDEVITKANETLVVDHFEGKALAALKEAAHAKKEEDFTVLISDSAIQKENRGLFWKLFSHKPKTESKKVEKPAQEVKVESVASKPEVKELHIVPPKAENTKKDDPNKADGNLFTSMFGKKEAVSEVAQNKKSIIDTIVAKSNDKKEVKKELVAAGGAESDPSEAIALLKFSSLLFQFSIVFVGMSAVFFYTQNMDEDNRFLPLVGIEENYAGRLHSASTKLDEQDSFIIKSNAKIEMYQSGYDDKLAKTVVTIIDERVNWPDILLKINEITDSVYEHNAISQYVKYDSFSFDAEKGLVSVRGNLSDPLGKNLTKLAELEEAFNYYPKDKNNPEDKTKPYFYNLAEFSTLSKSYNKKTGKYTSSFRLSFTLDEK